ncbi:DNA oxidative demethylase AlkB [Lonsdalea populi]|uniref:DNA oxidative demethylase AlkB n=1 Tax=Lonsdalea populi TaxID=1172565 RepID=UPI000A25A8C9|nr:DNA oxidative demethylase AlkB [Lonsdalea populi]OSM94213.1 alpha-ketoglutarate-dependent dioxygenase AlkB [Lonsdalea populi]RAT71678.1 alpha-ketoglutarate-dependent dioxygenase AlkB [Lonsdalea populi]RAT72458.1 alpha-ketoglutarate-dependent dioxygenase AlkB [Lonsdalea populi]RAT72536.1 alpha-ketoglutarate-dependent dioxygenase AlkB [Lonsdalea populi]RAT78727.1 alpha-ketoglutarate-dependent dioxygenase AlkB [Lonsdalea populi]
MNFDLFADERPERRAEILAPGAVVLRGYVWDEARTLLDGIRQVSDSAPFRHLTTPGGYGMSVAMSNCGPLGWVSDERGYRYDAYDPLSGRPWPDMPPLFYSLATAAAEEAGFPGFRPDACLINRYSQGARLSLHQDKDEHDLEQPIVSFSLGLNAVFLFGGSERSDPCQRVLLSHGDVVVWGGESRLFYHAIQPLKPGPLPSGMPGEYRFNLTFRKVR